MLANVDLFNIEQFYPLLKEGVMIGLLIISSVALIAIGINFALRLFKP